MPTTKSLRLRADDRHEGPVDRAATVGAKAGLVLIAVSLVVALAVSLYLDLDDPAESIGLDGGVSISHFGAQCDGQTDDTEAFRSGIAAMQVGGGTLIIPEGTCLIGGGGIGLGNVSVRGVGERSVLTFTGAATIMRIDASNVTFSNVTLVHSGTQNSVLFLLRDTTATGLTFDHVVLDGQAPTKPNYAMGMWIESGGEYRNIRILNSTFTGFTYAIGINSNFAGVLDGLTVDASLFHNNYADDVEINTPAGTGRNITVTNSTFRDNLAGHERAGFGVGFANVSGVLVKNNTFSGYPIRPIHIEDRSFDITIEGNTMSNGATGLLESHASYIFIVNGANDVRLFNNTIDASANSNPTFCVYAGEGGGAHGAASNITGSGNTFTACRGFTGQPTYGDVNLTDTLLQ